MDEARRRIREALALFIDNAAAANLTDRVKLPPSAAKAVRDYVALRKRADAEGKRAATAARVAVRLLQKSALKMSARDAARLLGLSHQRVHQLANSR